MITASPVSGLESLPDGSFTCLATVAARGSTTGRRKDLDVVRALAVLLVLGHHMRSPPDGTSMAWRLGSFWIRTGWIGVDLFFVLSGFLVSGILFREYLKHGHVRVGRFLVRRAFKIYPAFYALMGATALVFTVPMLARFRWSSSISWRNLLAEALFTQNYLPSVWNHTWSLAVEEHFYLLVGLICWWRMGRASTNPTRLFMPVLVAIAVATLLMRAVHFHFSGPNYSYTHLRIDSLSFGFLLSWLYYFHPRRFIPFVRSNAKSILAASVALLLPQILWAHEDSAFTNIVGYSLLYLAFGGLLSLIICNAGGVSRVFRRLEWMAPAGVYSYSIYLFHMPVRRGTPLLLARLWPSAGFLVHLFAYFGGSLVVGVMAARLVELPALALREHWFPDTPALGVDRSVSPADSMAGQSQPQDR
jgi:peptidoglycan/LPS O-acetylase OafA/YrhL